jgi:GrpB-like predicted nucleotidyltransferase (UPF0157 family)
VEATRRLAPAIIILEPHRSAWSERARDEAARLLAALPEVLNAVHHIGSTAVPNLAARLDDAVTGKRLVHLHCYQAEDSAIARHLAFRDLLRTHPQTAAEYEREKCRCAALNPEGGAAYTACKGEWIRSVEARFA